MAASVTPFDPQPRPDEVPDRMPSPFAIGPPHPLAQRAADAVRRELAAGLADRLGLARDGKMFGVLVVRDRDGRFGFLRAFSGMVDRQWELPGFVPPAFDQQARDAFWVAGEQELIAIADQMADVDRRMVPLREQAAALAAEQLAEVAALREQHRAAKRARKLVRETTTDPAALAALDRESAQHTKARDAQKQSHAWFRGSLANQLAPLQQLHATLDHERAARSRDYLGRIHGTYVLPNARGELVSLRALFAPDEPPGGAGDCAAPKLLAYAYAHELAPIALAEFWVGAEPATGGRRDGAFYPACRGKCGPILGHMLAGLPHDPAPTYGETAIDPAAPLTLYEDRWLAVLVKPVGLLSVPGRSSKADSVLARLRLRYPDATGPMLAHRLDLDTSGLMLAAKDTETYAALQRQFAERTIDKRYIALLDGVAVGDEGTVDLPLRVDLDDRPRQIVDPVHGKRAITQWRVIARSRDTTRVALYPQTGRAHQLRVHAAHPSGIGVPIVGDRLYGRPASRLMLHAEAIAFEHPHTKERLAFEQTAPF